MSMATRNGRGEWRGNVLIEQAGLPVPALPAMIVGGALAAEGRLSPWGVLGAAVGRCGGGLRLDPDHREAARASGAAERGVVRS
jgi:hypothetical protein